MIATKTAQCRLFLYHRMSRNCIRNLPNFTYPYAKSVKVCTTSLKASILPFVKTIPNSLLPLKIFDCLGDFLSHLHPLGFLAHIFILCSPFRRRAFTSFLIKTRFLRIDRVHFRKSFKNMRGFILDNREFIFLINL